MPALLSPSTQSSIHDLVDSPPAPELTKRTAGSSFPSGKIVIGRPLFNRSAKCEDDVEKGGEDEDEGVFEDVDLDSDKEKVEDEDGDEDWEIL